MFIVHARYMQTKRYDVTKSHVHVHLHGTYRHFSVGHEKLLGGFLPALNASIDDADAGRADENGDEHDVIPHREVILGLNLCHDHYFLACLLYSSLERHG